MGIGSVVSSVVNAVTGKSTDGAKNEISASDALARFKDKDSKALETWSNGNLAEFKSYLEALGKNKPSDISNGLLRSACDFISTNVDQFNLPKDKDGKMQEPEKNLYKAALRKKIFAEMTQDAYADAAKIKHDWHI